MSGAGLAGAQVAPPETLEPVVVTGSLIPRLDGETAFPVQIIRRQEIERSGALTVEEIVGRISANLNGGVVAVGQNNEHPSYSGVSLRGFGPHATLVLLNGRRLANHAFGDESGIGVDLNTIPLAAVDRIEVLKDGASAIYGSDAIAGVVNFILRSDFHGIDASAERLSNQQGGGGRRRETLTAGIGDAERDGYNALLVIDHQQQDALHAVARPYAATANRPDLGLTGGLSASSFPANIATPQGLVNPAAPACGGKTVLVGSSCRYDSTSDTDLLPPDDNLSALARASLGLAGDSRAYVELVGSRHRTTFATAPSPVNAGGLPDGSKITIPVGSPFYPTQLGLVGDIVDPSYRSVSLGNRIEQVTTQQGRALIGYQGKLRGWDIDGAISQSVSLAATSYVSGFLDSARIVDAFNSGQLNPFGASTAAGDALLRAAQVAGVARSARGTERTVDLRGNRELAQWSTGTLSLGVGIEARSEFLEDSTTALGLGTLGGQFSDSKSGSRRAQAAYAELAVPVAKTLEAQLALRVDRYSDYGASTSPKLGLRWQAASPLVLRGSVGTGFRAPSLPELYTTQVHFTDVPFELPDPKRCVATQLDSDCNVSARLTSGGNPALGPERSRQASIGLVFEPMRGFLASIDWWKITLTHTIGQLPDQAVLSGDDRFEGKNIVRGPVDPAFPNLPGPILSIVEINENLGKLRASGFDVDLRATSAPSRWGRVSAQLTGSHLDSWATAFDGVNETSVIGTYFGGSFPRWQHTLTLGWDRQPWSASVVQTWRQGYVDERPDLDGNPRRVSPYRTWDAQVAYGNGRAGLRVAAGVKNVFNRPPPVSNQSDNFQVGYDPTYADPRGRGYYLRVGYGWH